MADVSFFYDYGSPYSYLAWTQLPRLVRLGAAVMRMPLSVLALQRRVGNPPTPMTCAPKRAYVAQDIQRWADHYRVPLAANPAFVATDFRALLRGGTLAPRLGELPAYDDALWPALWARGADLASVGRLGATLAGSGIDAAAMPTRSRKAPTPISPAISTAPKPWARSAHRLSSLDRRCSSAMIGSPSSNWRCVHRHRAKGSDASAEVAL